MYHEFRAERRQVCTTRLLAVWGAYALATVWIWNCLTSAGFPAPAIWALAGMAGALLLPATREI